MGGAASLGARVGDTTGNPFRDVGFQQARYYYWVSWNEIWVLDDLSTNYTITYECVHDWWIYDETNYYWRLCCEVCGQPGTTLWLGTFCCRQCEEIAFPV